MMNRAARVAVYEERGRKRKTLKNSEERNFGSWGV